MASTRPASLSSRPESLAIIQPLNRAAAAAQGLRPGPGLTGTAARRPSAGVPPIDSQAPGCGWGCHAGASARASLSGSPLWFRWVGPAPRTRRGPGPVSYQGGNGLSVVGRPRRRQGPGACGVSAARRSRSKWRALRDGVATMQGHRLRLFKHYGAGGVVDVAVCGPCLRADPKGRDGSGGSNTTITADHVRTRSPPGNPSARHIDCRLLFVFDFTNVWIQ